MKEKRITIEIDEQGSLTADAEGFSGDACLRDLDKLLEGLGTGVSTVERKPDAGTLHVTSKKTLTTGRKS
jgi:hypothetical protein